MFEFDRRSFANAFTQTMCDLSKFSYVSLFVGSEQISGALYTVHNVCVSGKNWDEKYVLFSFVFSRLSL